MTERRLVAGSSPWEPIAGYSRAVRVGPHVYVSGTTATDENGQIVAPGDARAQTFRALDNVRRGLEKAGATLEDVVRTRIFVTDIDRAEEIARAHGEIFGEIRPACTLVEVGGLVHPRMLVEIEARRTSPGSGQSGHPCGTLGGRLCLGGDSMPVWLSGEHHGKRIHHCVAGDACTIGRGTANDLVLPSQTVSRNHARLRVTNGNVLVTDLGSLNGTRVNGEIVEASREAALGDVIEFGSVLLRVTDGIETATPILKDPKEVSQSLLLSREDTSVGDTGGLTAHVPGLLSLLTEAGQLLVLPGDPEDTFDRLLELVERTIPANRIMILLSDDGGEPVQRAARIQGDRAISPLMLSRTMVRMVIDDGASILTGDAQADERFRHQQSIVAQDMHSAMAVPLTHNEDVLGVLYVDTNDPIATYSEHDLRVLTLLGQMLGAKIANTRLLEVAREQQRMQEELNTAALIQKRLLPQTLPEVPGYEILGAQDTCEAVGGDLYDAGVLPDGRFQIVLGDVSGKGIGAALLMSEILGTIRALRGIEMEPHEFVARLDKGLIGSTQPEHYLTLFLGALDPETHRLEYVNGGHPPPYLLLPGEEPLALEPTGVPVGLVDLPGVEFGKETIDFPPGATLVIYSDGVSEAKRGEEFFGDERLLTILRECRGLASAPCAEKLQEAVDSFLGDEPALDDTTLLLVHHEL